MDLPLKTVSCNPDNSIARVVPLLLDLVCELVRVAPLLELLLVSCEVLSELLLEYFVVVDLELQQNGECFVKTITVVANVLNLETVRIEFRARILCCRLLLTTGGVGLSLPLFPSLLLLPLRLLLTLV